MGLELIDLVIQCGEESETNVPDGQLVIPGSGLFKIKVLGQQDDSVGEDSCHHISAASPWLSSGLDMSDMVHMCEHPR